MLIVKSVYRDRRVAASAAAAGASEIPAAHALDEHRSLLPTLSNNHGAISVRLSVNR